MKREKAKIAGLILAAGHSSRMGDFKPLMPFGQSTVIENAVSTFLKAGVVDVKVVVGWHAEEITPVLANLNVTAILNPHFEAGMLSSVVAGVSSMSSEVEAFLLLPGDYPLVRPGTVQCLIDAYLENEAGIVYPLFNGRRGHPPLIARKYMDNAPLEMTGGLRTLLRQYDSDALDVFVTDQGVVTDLDEIGDYLKALAYSSED